ncbi:Ig-like domain-containing protein [Klebsiella pneumoniae]
MKLSQATASIAVGDTRAVTVDTVPTDADDKEAVLAAVTWSSDAEATATVADGTIKAVAAGTANVTATSGTFTASVAVTVHE